MGKLRFSTLGIVICLIVGSSPAIAVRIDTTMVDGLKIKTPTRVQAGKSFQVNINSKKEIFDGICWLEWSESKGFAIPKAFRMKKSAASVKLLPIQPGPGTMSFYCGTDRRNTLAGGSAQIYIAP